MGKRRPRCGSARHGVARCLAWWRLARRHGGRRWRMGEGKGLAAMEAVGAKEAVADVGDIDCFSLLMPNGLLLLLLARPSRLPSSEFCRKLPIKNGYRPNGRKKPHIISTTISERDYRFHFRYRQLPIPTETVGANRKRKPEFSEISVPFSPLGRTRWCLVRGAGRRLAARLRSRVIYAIWAAESR
ncbi:hypothetical protein [Oryza sativa Japonica Group]|uniref:p0696G06.21 protein n=1 Tax=Oryza sativa subsp. japonica TaxID=39947 RepID=Q8L521_ORYSJ|nr:P0696G06.21 [Oryza sativa Japonica Group]BAC06879.1 hypothetical protein [Oryza sativa Japonica Group]